MGPVGVSQHATEPQKSRRPHRSFRRPHRRLHSGQLAQPRRRPFEVSFAILQRVDFLEARIGDSPVPADSAAPAGGERVVQQMSPRVRCQLTVPQDQGNRVVRQRLSCLPGQLGERVAFGLEQVPQPALGLGDLGCQDVHDAVTRCFQALSDTLSIEVLFERDEAPGEHTQHDRQPAGDGDESDHQMAGVPETPVGTHCCSPPLERTVAAPQSLATGEATSVEKSRHASLVGPDSMVIGINRAVPIPGSSGAVAFDTQACQRALSFRSRRELISRLARERFEKPDQGSLLCL